jgi:hypothetical protein
MSIFTCNIMLILSFLGKEVAENEGVYCYRSPGVCTLSTPALDRTMAPDTPGDVADMRIRGGDHVVANLSATDVMGLLHGVPSTQLR